MRMLLFLLMALLVPVVSVDAQTPSPPVAKVPADQPAFIVEPYSPSVAIAVRATGARLRERPFANRDTAILGVAEDGAPLVVIGRSRQADGDWYQIRLSDGRVAFIRSDLTTDSPENSNWIEQVVELGKIGNGYSHGQFPSWGRRTHPGVDIGGGEGRVVKAAADGEVVRIVSRPSRLRGITDEKLSEICRADGNEDDVRDYCNLGNAVVVRHAAEADGSTTFTLYLHLRDPASVVGSLPESPIGLGTVRKGDIIGQSSDTGSADGPHLHFEVRHFEGTRHVYHPTHGNIYVSGDAGGARGLQPDWSDPKAWLEDQGEFWITRSTSEFELRLGEARGEFRLSEAGRAYFSNEDIGTIPAADRARLRVYPAPTGRYVLAVVADEVFEGLHAVVIDLKTGRALAQPAFRLGDFGKYGFSGSLAWSPNGNAFAVELKQWDGLSSLLVVELDTGSRRIVDPWGIDRTVEEKAQTFDDMSRMGWHWRPLMGQIKQGPNAARTTFEVVQCLRLNEHSSSICEQEYRQDVNRNFSTPHGGDPDAGCRAQANANWVNQDSTLLVEVQARGISCETSVVRLTIRAPNGSPVYTWLGQAHHIFGLSGAKDAQAMSAALADWIAAKDSTSSDLHPWEITEGQVRRAEFPFTPSPWVNEQIYGQIRAAGLPMFCFAQGFETMNCLVLRGGAVEQIGTWAFPG